MPSRRSSTLVYLLLGTLTTVFVAWGCALFAESPVLRSPPESDVEARWVAPVDASWPETPHLMFFGESRGHRVRVAQCVGRRPHPEPGRRWLFYVECRVETHAFGWPAYALRRDKLVANGDARNRYGLALPAAVEGLSRTRQADLPLLPIWPGFAVNVLLFASVAWVLLDGHRAVRRATWGWRGRCAGCGYDLRRSGDGCPECGSGRHAS